MAATATKRKSGRKKKGRPPLGHSCPLLSFGVVHRGLDDWRVVLADEPARVRVTPTHIKNGVPRSTSHCVFALAFADYFGPDFTARIGPSVTSIISEKDKVELRVHTPVAIARKLRHYDRTGNWDLPPGIYRFGPIAKIVRTGEHAKNQKFTRLLKVIRESEGKVKRKTKRKALSQRLITRNAQIAWPA